MFDVGDCVFVLEGVFERGIILEKIENMYLVKLIKDNVFCWVNDKNINLEISKMLSGKDD